SPAPPRVVRRGGARALSRKSAAALQPGAGRRLPRPRRAPGLVAPRVRRLPLAPRAGLVVRPPRRAQRGSLRGPFRPTREPMSELVSLLAVTLVAGATLA